MLFLYLLPKKIRSQLKQNQTSLLHLINVILTFFLCALLFIILFKFSEDTNWNEAIWQVWQTATTVGYGNAPAENISGRIITMIFGTLSIAYLPILIGYVFDLITSRREKRRLGYMKNKTKNGYTIFNFPGLEKSKRFISEIRTKEQDVSFCIVDSKLNEIPREIELLGDITFVRGGLLDQETYEQANIKNAKTIIVFPVNHGVPESDSTTQTIVQLIEQFINKERTRVIHVLVDPKHEWLFKDTISTQVLEDVSLFAAVQECQDVYSAKIIEKILSNTEGANPHTVSPKIIIGWTWGKFISRLTTKSIDNSLNINVFALIQNGIPDSCPDSKTIISVNDKISILAKNDFNWSHIEKSL